MYVYMYLSVIFKIVFVCRSGYGVYGRGYVVLICFDLLLFKLFIVKFLFSYLDFMYCSVGVL